MVVLEQPGVRDPGSGQRAGKSLEGPASGSLPPQALPRLSAPLPDDRQREEASSGGGFGPEDAPGQRGDMFAKGGLVGGQKKLDKNNDGKISGEDFKILRSCLLVIFIRNFLPASP